MEEEDENQTGMKNNRKRQHQQPRDGKVIENGWLADEVVTMIDESPENDDQHRRINQDDKESAI